MVYIESVEMLASANRYKDLNNHYGNLASIVNFEDSSTASHVP